MSIELFGTLSVSAMAVCYALEERAPRYTLLFAFACVASSAYAVMIRSWPFAVVEALWAGVALRRFVRRNTRERSVERRISP